ncbi:MAG: hypothetical protein V8S36_08310 [Lachnospiraceae bacterium]
MMLLMHKSEMVQYQALTKNPADDYPNGCYYLSGSSEVGMRDSNGTRRCHDEVSGIAAKSEAELKSEEFLATLNASDTYHR